MKYYAYLATGEVLAFSTRHGLEREIRSLVRWNYEHHLDTRVWFRPCAAWAEAAGMLLMGE